MRSRSLQQRLLLWYWLLIIAPFVVDAAPRLLDVSDPAGNVPDLVGFLIDFAWTMTLFLSTGTLLVSVALWRRLDRAFSDSPRTAWLVPLTLLGLSVVLNLLRMFDYISPPLSVFD